MVMVLFYFLFFNVIYVIQWSTVEMKDLEYWAKLFKGCGSQKNGLL
jgi:hypothetical protein